ncbi:hypothetical protein GQ54DRAFT_107995 [Martensiomyces pterosporus]|nr:hypothetical protein GQ54DRAFT_107995 [Martensiomyces pterosporus]
MGSFLHTQNGLETRSKETTRSNQEKAGGSVKLNKNVAADGSSSEGRVARTSGILGAKGTGFDAVEVLVKVQAVGSITDILDLDLAVDGADIKRPIEPASNPGRHRARDGLCDHGGLFSLTHIDANIDVAADAVDGCRARDMVVSVDVARDVVNNDIIGTNRRDIELSNSAVDLKATKFDAVSKLAVELVVAVDKVGAQRIQVGDGGGDVQGDAGVGALASVQPPGALELEVDAALVVGGLSERDLLGDLGVGNNDIHNIRRLACRGDSDMDIGADSTGDSVRDLGVLGGIKGVCVKAGNRDGRDAGAGCRAEQGADAGSSELAVGESRECLRVADLGGAVAKDVLEAVAVRDVGPEGLQSRLVMALVLMVTMAGAAVRPMSVLRVVVRPMSVLRVVVRIMSVIRMAVRPMPMLRMVVLDPHVDPLIAKGLAQKQPVLIVCSVVQSMHENKQEGKEDDGPLELPAPSASRLRLLGGLGLQWVAGLDVAPGLHQRGAAAVRVDDELDSFLVAHQWQKRNQEFANRKGLLSKEGMNKKARGVGRKRPVWVLAASRTWQALLAAIRVLAFEADAMPQADMQQSDPVLFLFCVC